MGAIHTAAEMYSTVNQVNDYILQMDPDAELVFIWRKDGFLETTDTPHYKSAEYQVKLENVFKPLHDATTFLLDVMNDGYHKYLRSMTRWHNRELIITIGDQMSHDRIFEGLFGIHPASIEKLANWPDEIGEVPPDNSVVLLLKDIPKWVEKSWESYILPRVQRDLRKAIEPHGFTLQEVHDDKNSHWKLLPVEQE